MVLFRRVAVHSWGATAAMRLDMVSHHEIVASTVLRNLSPARLYELAVFSRRRGDHLQRGSGHLLGEEDRAEPQGQAGRRAA